MLVRSTLLGGLLVMSTYNGMSGIDAAMDSLARVSDNTIARGPRKVTVTLPADAAVALVALSRRFGLSMSEVASTLLYGAIADTGTAEIAYQDISFDTVKDAGRLLDRSRVKRSSAPTVDDTDRYYADHGPCCSPNRIALIPEDVDAFQALTTAKRSR